MNHYCIVTPTHKPELSTIEIKRLKASKSKNHAAKHYFVVPNSMNLRQIKNFFPESDYIKFDDDYFKSTQSYSNLMLMKSTYETFSDFKYILINQADAFVTKNISPLLMNNPNYIGAAWNPPFVINEIGRNIFVNRKWVGLNKTTLESGNGGLSIRNIPILLECFREIDKYPSLQKQFQAKTRKINEDLLLVFMLKKLKLEVLSAAQANRIFIETTPIKTINMKNVYGFHALEKYQPGYEKRILDKLMEDI